MAFLKRAGTLQIHSESKDLEVKVGKFQCHDETTLGKHHKKWNWTFNIGESNQEWQVKVDQAVVGANTLHFTIDGRDVFKNKMQQDFEHKLPVRGTLKLDKEYEVKSMSSDQWYHATLTAARADGKYEAEVLMPPDQYGNQKKVHYPIVEANRIRDPFTKKAVEVPSSTLCLAVKKDSALLPELTVNGNPFTSYFCVPSPAANKPPAEISFTVNKDRSNMIADIGHGKMNQALDATKPGYKVRSKACHKEKLKCEWEIQIGAFGEHHIVVEKKSKSSKEVNVSIDGIPVVSGSAADLGGAEWSADVAIQGKLALKYKLHKTNASGVATDQATIVTKRLLHSNTVRITVPDLGNLQTATLECDEMEFSHLEQCKALPTEPVIDDSLEVCESTHGISVPYAMDGESSSSGSFTSDFADLVPGASGLFSMFTCCQQPAIDDDSQVVIGALSSSNSQWKEGDKSTSAPAVAMDVASNFLQHAP
jgi:hypothetical protein